ncbi:MAG TPA: alcohol dehydrogenase catalytic domain-containing protein, partial [Rhodothermales bacterium]
MKAVRLTGVGTLELREEAMPVPAPGEVLVRVVAVGVCGSDLHWFEESGIGDARLHTPLILGHEFAGEIASGPRTGERVAVDPAIVCGHCEYCRDGNPNFCENGRFAGHGVDGALREFMAWPEECLFRVPDHFTAADAAMLEPLGVAIHSVDLGKVRVGSSVGVIGCGPIGLFIVAVARAAGAGTIVASDRLPHRVELARRYGATIAVLADGDAERAAARDATGGRGLDVAFEAAGDDDAVTVAIDTVRSGARVVLAGIPSSDETRFV